MREGLGWCEVTVMAHRDAAEERQQRGSAEELLQIGGVTDGSGRSGTRVRVQARGETSSGLRLCFRMLCSLGGGHGCSDAGAAALDLFLGDDGRGGYVGSATVGARGRRSSSAVHQPSVALGTPGADRWFCCS